MAPKNAVSFHYDAEKDTLYQMKTGNARQNKCNALKPGEWICSTTIDMVENGSNMGYFRLGKNHETPDADIQMTNHFIPSVPFHGSEQEQYSKLLRHVNSTSHGPALLQYPLVWHRMRRPAPVSPAGPGGSSAKTLLPARGTAMSSPHLVRNISRSPLPFHPASHCPCPVAPA